ncbi:type IV pilin protein [Lysobacter changpingensis]|uniref:type IV pilin protein n=1 Tax=Lysobacter changpingensis TaxID=2792784 RepID=UPI00272EA628|nr:type IV pilin protein [Lysobacter changpingensis]
MEHLAGAAQERARRRSSVESAVSQAGLPPGWRSGERTGRAFFNYLTGNLTMRNKATGFTLIELMIVVAVIAVLAALAYPSYQAHIAKTRRVAAGACLTELSHFAERYYTTKMTYEGAQNELPATTCRTELANHYDFSFAADPTASTYRLIAQPKGVQASKETKCGTLGVNQSGTKDVSVSGAVASDCF